MTRHCPGVLPSTPTAEAASDQLVLDTAMEAGHLLLESGAEIFRVEETMSRICRYYGVENGSFFVLSNGIFTTGGQYAKVQHIPVKGAQLDKVVAINQLSREIEQGKHTIQQVRTELARIRQMPAFPAWMQVLASGFGAAAFAVLFGGTLFDALAAFVAGLVLYLFVLYVSVPHLSRIIGNILGGAIATIVCILCRHFGLGDDMNHIIIGAIIPLVPGVSFTNGIRDLADGDYISGSVRLLDAILGFLCIAIGVGLTITFYHRMGGLQG